MVSSSSQVGFLRRWTLSLSSGRPPASPQRGHNRRAWRSAVHFLNPLQLVVHSGVGGARQAIPVVVDPTAEEVVEDSVKIAT